jgi:tRNA U34 2-thiouridine synthase MnmA/TrmU
LRFEGAGVVAARGQSAVLYRGDEALGGGIVAGEG